MQVMVLPDGTALHLIHWIYFDERWRICCAPHVEPDGSWQRTDDPRSVQCPHCQVTERWEKAINEARSPAADSAIQTAPGQSRLTIHFAIDGESACGRDSSGLMLRTDDARAVTCPACQATEACNKMALEAPGIPGRDFFRGR